MAIQIKRKGDFVHVHITEALNIYCATEAKDKLLQSLEKGQEVEVDLSELDELDTAGVQLMLMLKNEAQRLGKNCSFVNHSPAVREVIDLLNLATALGDPVVIPA